MTAHGTLALLTIPQLTNLFNTNTLSSLPERAKDVIAELERRGLIYDVA